MTNIPTITPAPGRKPRLVLFIAFPGMCMLDIAGPQTVFWCASRHMAERGLPGYEGHTVSLDGGIVPSQEGAGVHTEALADFSPADVDTIVVPGAPEIVAAVERSAGLVAWLRGAASAARRTASVCTGAFMLAKAGLLDGRRAATHWRVCDLLREMYPLVDVDRDAIFVQQDEIWTSAGVATGIDLALAMVEADCGRALALAVARELAVFVKRPSAQPQFSRLLQAQSNDGAMFDDLHLWIAENLDNERLSVELLAGRVQMSPRNFARVYKEKTGQTPAKAVENFRLEAARRLLEESDRNIDQIARQCGFGDEGRMRLTFQRNLQLSPKDYRSRLSAREGAGAARRVDQLGVPSGSAGAERRSD